MLHPKPLKPFGISVNLELHCFCCDTCQIALEPKQIQGHLHSSHVKSKIKLNQTILDQVIQDYDTCDKLPTLAVSEVIDAWEGIKVHEGFSCMHCSKAFLTADSMRKHHGTNHKNHPTPNTWPRYFVQRLTSRPDPESSFFKVNYQDNQAKNHVTDMIQSLTAQASALIKRDISSRNARSISPWLLSTHWHEHVNGYDQSELIQLIAVPKDDEFPGLQALVLKYMMKATTLIESTSELALQCLNTSDPMKGCVLYL